MKFLNWGTGIGLFYGLFMVSMIAVVWRSTQYDHALVSEEYYAEDLRYQQHFDKLANARDLEEQPTIQFHPDRKQVEFAFPEGMTAIEGEVFFFRPSDQSADFRVPLRLDPDNALRISTDDLKPGLWKVKVDWSSGDRAFYTEQIVVI